MNVILKKDIKKLGQAGEVVSVKDGYARNFLLPRDFACEANAENLQRIEVEKKRKVLMQEKEKGKLQKLAEEISGISCTVTAEANEEEQLYGSISEADIAAALETEKNITVDSKLIFLEQPIKALGIYDVEIRLHPEVTTKIRVWVTRN
ncbi:50S ribosomal protein L9 [Candidatus Omnitrophota bacterium]